ncbi:MAG: dihydroneopterin aldolase [Caldimonas sp.]
MRAAEAVVAAAVKVPVAIRAEARAPRAATKAVYTVFIRDLEIETCVGAFAHERVKPTVLMMDIEMEVASRAGTTDRLADAVDYGAVVSDLRRCMAGKRYHLLEKVCEFVASRILERFGALRVWVSAAKVGIIDGVGRVGVAVDRRGPESECSAAAVAAKADRPRSSCP